MLNVVSVIWYQQEKNPKNGKIIIFLSEKKNERSFCGQKSTMISQESSCTLDFGHSDLQLQDQRKNGRKTKQKVNNWYYKLPDMKNSETNINDLLT